LSNECAPNCRSHLSLHRKAMNVSKVKETHRSGKLKSRRERLSSDDGR
jgi:hypothetical protein